ncbi:ornithine cyclodeaminase family protein [Alteromonadaceae bacterium M269]|nr:ornithine cyclodeaminase family protein [Alteromonadaceae bacterium M269]
MNFIPAEVINQRLKPLELVDKLEHAFASDITTPMRQHFDIPNPFSSRENTLLVMPSWQQGSDIGIKLVTVTPDSHKYDLPSVQGVYVLFDAVKGNVKAMMDAASMTAKRTAAASALASRYLSRENSYTLLMVGTGTLSPELIKAHCAVRPIEQVFIWGRDSAKAAQVKDKINELNITISVVEHLADAVPQADIVSCATLSREPLVLGKWLQSGQHLDFVGAYRPDMREADDECVRRSRIVVDNHQSACKETGDIKTPLETGVLSIDDIEADLFELCRREKQFERQPSDITFFKSVGHALEDLAAAQLLTSKMDASE